MNIIVGLSGGVDSAVVAYLLKNSGHNVFAATALVWPNSRCCSDSAILEAQKIAQQLKIEHQVIDVVNEFSRDVVEDFVSKYFSGKTPNPCTRCNRYSRFAVFFDKAVAAVQKKHPELTDFYIATGHYLTVIKKHDRYLIKKGRDKTKDQSYMLYDLTQEQLSKLITPLGELKKTEVRKIAQKAKLIVSDKPDSQDACFAEGNYQKFILDYTERIPEPGDFVDKQGKILGKHRGIPFYTTGQRRGLNIAYSEPLYVVKIDAANNKIVLGTKEDLLSKKFQASNINWLMVVPKKKIKAMIKIRYQSSPIAGEIDPVSGEIVLKKFAEAITPGQVAAFYQRDLLVGGGTIL